MHSFLTYYRVPVLSQSPAGCYGFQPKYGLFWNWVDDVMPSTVFFELSKINWLGPKGTCALQGLAVKFSLE